ncbi:hypothetical protein ACPOL_2304 [Acidisarcina polymorpha]|uniref:Uncharacterized protein n=1 Tax=Acidisarcina polymorpha TaxID=2211140 RepID=A0A2Z5FXL6_9BACT|nr:hypothetical protein [Acidisarcina polymorpha]AXC11628.1 hypothetical protein ACPOL_2304 [Acidisarcina polymorpha]
MSDLESNPAPTNSPASMSLLQGCIWFLGGLLVSGAALLAQAAVLHAIAENKAK